jgi:hypothetical protein
LMLQRHCLDRVETPAISERIIIVATSHTRCNIDKQMFCQTVRMSGGTKEVQDGLE